MKNIMWLLILCSTFALGQPSNWKFMNPQPDGESYLSVKAIGNKVYACGLFGKIITSDDKGLAWNKQEWQTVRNLFKIDFYDENNGLVVGGSGDIFKTTNGGEKWVRKIPPENIKIKDLEYVNKDVVIAVGEGDYIYRSTDGGETWGLIKAAGKPGLWGVCYNKQNHIGLACGWCAAGGILLRTTDEGLNWTTVSGVTDTIPYYDINFIDENTAIAVGGNVEYQVIKKTTDGGLTWRNIEARQLALGLYANLESVKFADKMNGMIVGHEGVILRTTDGGENWQSINSQYTCNFDDVDFLDSQTGYIVGASGLILKTTNAGATWLELSKGNHNSLCAVSFSSAKDGVTAGGAGTVLITNDGGKNWVTKSAKTSYPFLTVKMIDAKNILAAGWRYDTYQRGVVMLTTDGGDNWSEVTPANPLFCPRSMDFFDNKNGLMTGFSYNTAGVIESNKGDVYKTTDGGKTWQKLTEILDPEARIPPMAIKILNRNDVVLIGEYGSFLKSTDGGSTWQNLSTLPYFSTTFGMQFLDESYGFANNMNGIYKTEDGGKSWKLLYDASTGNNTVKSIHFYNKNVGYAVGDGSTSPNYSLILKTTDGGASWDYEFPPTVNALTGVFAVSDTLAFIVGANGAILTNGTPGGISDVRNNNEIASGYKLNQNYPNPFNPSTTISYCIPKAGFVSITVYDVMGKEVARLANKEMQAGSHTVSFSPANLASGIYLYKISAGGFSQTRKMLYLK